MAQQEAEPFPRQGPNLLVLCRRSAPGRGTDATAPPIFFYQQPRLFALHACASKLLCLIGQNPAPHFERAHTYTECVESVLSWPLRVPWGEYPPRSRTEFRTSCFRWMSPLLVATRISTEASTFATLNSLDYSHEYHEQLKSIHFETTGGRDNRSGSCPVPQPLVLAALQQGNLRQENQLMYHKWASTGNCA